MSASIDVLPDTGRKSQKPANGTAGKTPLPNPKRGDKCPEPSDRERVLGRLPMENPGLLTAGLPRSLDANAIVEILEFARGRAEESHPSLLAEFLSEWWELPQDDLAARAVAWAHAFDGVSRVVPANLSGELAETLVRVGRESKASSDPWITQALGGEVPFVLGHKLPKASQGRDLIREGRGVMDSLMEELFDGEGMLHGRHWDSWLALAASWLRCRDVGLIQGTLPWSKPQERQFQEFVLNARRLLRFDGSRALDVAPARPEDALLMRGLVDSLSSADQRRSLTGLKPRLTSNGRTPGLRSPSVESEWSEAAILSSGWDRVAPRVVVNYSGGDVQTELSVDGRTVWSGNWTSSTMADGRELDSSTDWEQVCWISDEDADYLELECSLENGWRLQRHFLLCHEDGLLLLADSVFSDNDTPAAGSLLHEFTLPLAGLATEGEKDTTEIWLRDRAKRYRCVPLPLNEWRSAERAGGFSAEKNELRLMRTSAGRALFAPLIVDLRSNRARQPVTWRQLTIAEERRIVPSDTSAGFRLRIGKKNWLLYRSLGAVGNRTVLGHNLVSEFMFGRFLPDGTVEPLVEIEPAEEC